MTTRPYIQKVLIVFDAVDDVVARECGQMNLADIKKAIAHGEVTATTLRVLRTKEAKVKGPSRNLFREM